MKSKFSFLQGQSAPVTKEDLGRATWTFLHTLAAQVFYLLCFCDFYFRILGILVADSVSLLFISLCFSGSVIHNTYLKELSFPFLFFFLFFFFFFWGLQTLKYICYSVMFFFFFSHANILILTEIE